ncbi:hypothetical protein ACKGJI_07005 [Sulfurospirillum sp. 1307]
MNKTIENFLAQITSLSQLDANNLPEEVIEEMAKMSPEELFKTCSQFVVLIHNVPSENKMITLDEDEIMSLAQNYVKELVARFKS